jgi:hypothetical protein
MPLTGAHIGNFVGCRYDCSAGFYGISPFFTDGQCSGACWKGHYCPKGTSYPIPCPAGTYAPVRGSQSADSCIPCFPGTFSDTAGNSVGCFPCPAGSYSAALRSTSCTACPMGGFCASDGAASAAMAFTQCPVGTYNPDRGGLSVASCLSCPAGKANPVPGSESEDACRPCAPGTFSIGFFRPPLPPPPPPPSMPPPSSLPPPLLPPPLLPPPSPPPLPPIGRQLQQAQEQVPGTCTSCPAGNYEDDFGSTSCKTCPAGSYCPAGATTPIPCPGGTYGESEGLSAEEQCVDVVFGEWAPTGAAKPKLCFTGFYCPGRADDDVNTPPGSLPIQVSQGGSTTKQDAVRKELSLDMGIDDFNARQDEIKASLAAQYGVPIELISLEAAGGSVQITMTIATSDSSHAAILHAALSDVDDTALASALGVPVTSSAPTTVTLIQQKDCPKGFWCTAGLEVECDFGFYNPSLNANNQTACLKCPERSTTIAKASTRSDECVCEAGYFDADEGAGVRCKLCASGTSCSAVGTTLAALPLRRGYYRRLLSTTDVRRCPDAAVNCTASECPESTTGCRGTVLLASTNASNAIADALGCAPGLTGVYCMSCDRESSAANASSEQLYYAPATSSAIASCKPCGDTLALTVAQAIGILAIIVAALGVTYAAHRFGLSAAQKEKLAAMLKKFNLGVKLKILIVFCAHRARPNLHQAPPNAKPRRLVVAHPPPPICAPQIKSPPR